MPLWIASVPPMTGTVALAKSSGYCVTELTPNGPTPSAWLFNHLDTVDQHHNEFSQDPAYAELLVLGLAYESAFDALLSEFDLHLAAQFPWGFSALKHYAHSGA